MAASIEGSLRHRSRGRATIGWSELLPRYLLVEEALARKRVLEIGTLDLRSLLRIQDAKATRIVGTAPDISRFDSALLRGRRIELSPMEPGRIDFDDGSFDAILVVDLGLELTASGRFLGELKRVLARDGFCAIAYQAGRSFLELVEDGGSLVAIDPARLEEAVREAMPEARFYRQAPFIGVAIEPDTSGGGIALEPSPSGVAARPSHVIALWGRSAPVPEDRTLVELPFMEFEAITDAAHARASSDLSRVLSALTDAKREIARRDDSLREIGARLPRIRAALEARAGTLPSPAAVESDAPAQVYTDEQLKSLVRRVEEARDSLRAKLDHLANELESERSKNRRLEARVEELETSLVQVESAPQPSPSSLVADLDSGVHDTIIERSAQPLLRAEADIEALRTTLVSRDHAIASMENEATSLRDRAQYHETEASDLRARVEELESQLVLRTTTADTERAQLYEQITALRAHDAEREQELARMRERVETSQARRPARVIEARVETDAELHEAQRRVLQLERTTSMQEQKIDELRQEIESQLLVRHSLGSDYRDAEARIAYLQRKLEDQAFERTEQIRQLNARLSAVTDALSRVDHERDTLRSRTDELEKQNTDAMRRSEQAERALALLRQEQADQEREVRESSRALDSSRRESLEKAGEATWLHRAVAERDAQIEKLRTEKVALEADKRAVELAAAHFGQELHTLRTKNQALVYERDTLATTSRMLLEERDAAAAIARRTMEAEERASGLGESLEGAQAAIARLEVELVQSLDRERGVKARSESLDGERANLAGELERARLQARDEAKRAERAERERAIAEARVKELDQGLAGLEHRLRQSEQSRDTTTENARGMEDLLRQAARALSEARREGQVWRERADELLRAAAENEQERGQLLAARARAESEAAAAAAIALDLKARGAVLSAECAEARSRSHRLQGMLERARAEAAAASSRVSPEELHAVRAEKQSLELALSRTLEEAAQLSAHARDLEVQAQSHAEELARGERERIQIERQHYVAEEARHVAEEARRYLTAELHVTRQQLAALETERNELLRNTLVLDQLRYGLETALEEARAQASAASLQEIEAYQRKIERLTADLDRAQNNTRQARSDDEGSRAKITRLEEEIERLRGTALARLAEREDLLAQASVRSASHRHTQAASDVVRALDDELRVAGQHLRVAEAQQVEHLSDRTVRAELEVEIALLRERLAEVRAAAAARVVEPAGEQRADLEREIARWRAEAVAERMRAYELQDQIALVQAELEARTDRSATEQRATVLVERLEAEEMAGRGRLWADAKSVLEHRSHAMEAELQRASHAVQALEQELAHARSGSDGALAQVRSELAAAQAHIEGLESELATAANAEDALESELAELRSEAELVRDAISLAHEELDTARARVEALQADLGAAHERASTAEARLVLAETRAKGLEQKAADAESKVVALEWRASNAENRLEAAEAQSSELDQKLTAVQARASDIEAVAQRSEVELADVTARLRDAETALVSRDEALDEVRTAAEARAHEYAELQAALADAESRVRALEAALVDLQARAGEREEIEAEKLQVEERTREVELELEALRAHAGAELRSLRTSLENAEGRARAAESELALLRDELENAEARARAGEEGHIDSVSRAHDVESRIAELELSLAQAEERSQAAEAKLQAAEERIREAARAGAPVPSDDLRRLAARANEAEDRAKRAEFAATQAQGLVDQASLRAAQAEAKAAKGEERADRAESAFRKTEIRARQAEDRATHAEAAAHQLEQRARDAENKQRLAEKASGDAEDRAAHAEKRAREAETSLKMSEARALSSAVSGDTPARLSQLELQLKDAEDRAARADNARSEAVRRLAELEAARAGGDVAELDRLRADLAHANSRVGELTARVASGIGSGSTTALKARCETLEAAVTYRDAEIKRLKGACDETASHLDQARADVGRKLTEIRSLQHSIEATKHELTSTRSDVEQLRTKLGRQGDADELKTEVERREQEIARLNADATTRSSEVTRLRTLLQRAEQSQVQLERRLVELESAVAEGNQKIEMLKREVAEKSERLRRLSGLPE